MCINPNNPKTAHLKGKRVIVPLINREIPVIGDEYGDMKFGTGCLKVTPAHDINDYMLGEKYNLPSIDIFNDNGTLNANGAQYAEMDRFECRKQIEKDLEIVPFLRHTHVSFETAKIQINSISPPFKSRFNNYTLSTLPAFGGCLLCMLILACLFCGQRCPLSYQISVAGIALAG